MSERMAAKIETVADRTAACASLGSRAVGNCIECPAAIGCPILQLKQRSQEMVTATVTPDSQSADVSSVYGGGGDFTALPQFATIPTAPKPTKLDIVRQREAAAAAKPKSLQEMSDAEIRKCIDRMQLEKQYKGLYRELHPKQIAAGEKFCKIQFLCRRHFIEILWFQTEFFCIFLYKPDHTVFIRE